jgi:cyclopropane-fatty-acyl-phospholipid synthase
MTTPVASSSMTVATPLIVPVPSLLGGEALLRRAAVRLLRSRWRGGRLDLVLPSGEVVALGGGGPAEGVVHIHHDRTFARLVLRGELGVGEAFVAGDWSSPDLVAAARVFLRGSGARGVESPLTWLANLSTRRRHRRDQNTRAGSARNIHAHYDLGNAFYQLMLDDQTLAYSAALWDQPGLTLAGAQQRKFERLCELLALGPDDHLLEIGCGWGGMAIHAARTRGCRVTAVTVSRQQLQLAQQRVAAAGLADRVTLEFCDYRDLVGTYDKVVSVEMIEAVGHEHLPGFFQACARALRPGGRMALQAITMPDERYETYRRNVDWMQTYIFPGSLIPSLGALRQASGAAGLAWQAAHDLGPDYAPTLAAWRERFVAALPQVRALGFDEPFVRAWLLYLSFSEAAFAERTLGDHHVVLSKPA